MPGYLSSMFEPQDGGSDSHQGQQHLGAEDDADFQPEVGVHTDNAVSYEDPDGTTHSYESSQDLTLTVGVEATLGAAADTTEGFASDHG